MSFDLTTPAEDPVSLSATWRTDIMGPTRGGTEQRVATRSRPRWSLSYRLVLTTEEEAAILRWQIAQNLSSTMRVPIWFEGHRITTGAASGQPELVGDFSDTNLVVGDLVYIQHRNGVDGEFGTALTVAAGLLTLDANLGATYPAKSRVFLAVEALVAEGQGLDRRPVDVTEVDVTITPTSSRAFGGASASLTTYQSLPVLDRPPVGDTFPEVYEGGTQRIDFGGAIEVVDGWDVPRTAYQRALFLSGRSEQQWFRLFCDTIKGERDPFWAPTWRRDFPVTGAVASSTTITVADDPAGAVTAWFAEGGERHVQIKHTDGTVYHREVTAVGTPSGGNVALTVDSANPVALADMRALSLLELCRLGSPTVQMEFSGFSAFAALAVRTVGGEAADA